jgi:pyruvate kinase
MPESLDALIARLDRIEADLRAAVMAHGREIDAVAPEHRAGATNLVRYTALRQQDLRDLQNDLMDLGATSLATSEANVLAKMQAARNVLAALRGDPGPWDLGAINEALDEGDDVLDANARALFGAQRPDRPTRIMVTMPAEAADEPQLLAAFVDAGMDVARINCAHDGPAEWERMIGHIRAAADAVRRKVLVSMDLAGPKLRTGPISDGPAIGRARVSRDATGRLTSPARLWLVASDRPTTPAPAVVPVGRAALTIQVDPAWLSDRRAGDVVQLRDVRGRRRTFTVAEVAADGVLAEGDRGAYVADGTPLECAGRTTAASGIPPLPRRLSLAPGDRLVLASDLSAVDLPPAGEPARIGCTLPEVVAALRPGQPVLLDDGAIDAVVESTAAGEATLMITRTKPGGQRLGAEKGINLPETELPLPALTAEDESYLPFIAANADVVAVSFVRSATDVEQVIKALDDVGADHLGLVLKIETAQGFRELPSILLAAMRRARLGLMIARGPAIWATQVLETLAKTGQPSRAEITDAAAGQRAECVMLNKGPHVAEAIRALDDILGRMGEVQRKSRTLMRRVHSWDGQ